MLLHISLTTNTHRIWLLLVMNGITSPPKNVMREFTSPVGDRSVVKIPAITTHERK